MATNVILNHASPNHMSRMALIEWVNKTLDAEFTKVEELCTGAAYCQLMHRLFPNSIPIRKIKFYTNIEYEFIQNFTLLQNAFNNFGVDTRVPTEKLIKGRFQDNLEFLQWFKRFYDANDRRRDYDAFEVRQAGPIGLKPLMS